MEGKVIQIDYNMVIINSKLVKKSYNLRYINGKLKDLSSDVANIYEQ